MIQNHTFYVMEMKSKKRWFPKICSGETIGALAMTEPGGGAICCNQDYSKR